MTSNNSPGSIAGLTNSTAYINDTPDLTHYWSSINAAESLLYGGSEIDNYGDKTTGWIIPPSTGQYNFFIMSDDNGAFFLSTDDNAANLQGPICYEGNWDAAWTAVGGGTQVTTTPIQMTGGQPYYFMALHEQGGGGEEIEIAMQNVTDTSGTSDLAPITGTNLAFTVPGASSTLTIYEQPASATAVNAFPVTFTVGAYANSVLGTNIMLYQWYKNGAPVAGGTASSLIFAADMTTDNGRSMTARSMYRASPRPAPPPR